MDNTVVSLDAFRRATRAKRWLQAHPPVKAQQQKIDLKLPEPELSKIDDVIARSLHAGIRIGGVARTESSVSCFWREINSVDEITVRKVAHGAAGARYEMLCNKEIIASGVTFTPPRPCRFTGGTA